MSEELLGRILEEVTGIRTGLDGVRAEVSGLRADLRTERDESALGDIAMARLDRLDATNDTIITELRALHRQANGLAARVTAIEERGAKGQGQDD